MRKYIVTRDVINGSVCAALNWHDRQRRTNNLLLMIKLSHSTFFRANKETLANLVSLDLLVLMVSL